MARVKKTTAKKPSKPSKKEVDVIEDPKILEEEVTDSSVLEDVTAVQPEEMPDNGEIKSTQPEPEKGKPVFIPLLIGGVLAGTIGFGVATYYFTNIASNGKDAVMSAVETSLNAQTEGQRSLAARIDGLTGELAKVAADDTALDAVAKSADASEQRDEELTTALSDLSAVFSQIDARLVVLEKRPISEAGGVTSEAAAAYEKELSSMKELLEAQRNEMEALASEVTARIQNATQQAASIEEVADATVKAATANAALSKIQNALDSGEAFKAALEEISASGVDVPAVLSNAAAVGVPTLSLLKDKFPDAARNAISATSKTSVNEGALGRLGAFFRAQVGARSIEPREGNDPDAVLSRAEAALKDGDLDVAIALVMALPKEGKIAMNDWLSMARSRDGAILAVRRLARQITEN